MISIRLGCCNQKIVFYARPRESPYLRGAYAFEDRSGLGFLRLWYGCHSLLWKATGEATSFADFAGNLELGIMAGQNVFDDGKTQTGSAGPSSGIDPIEALRQSGKIFCWNPGSRINDIQPNPLTILLPAHRH